MSQEKVDRYKQEKANRKKNIAKEKRKKKIYVLLGALVGAAFVAWIGFSVYKDYIEEPTQPVVTLSPEQSSKIEEMLGNNTTAKQDETTSKKDETTTAAEGETTTSAEEETTTGAESEK